MLDSFNSWTYVAVYIIQIEILLKKKNGVGSSRSTYQVIDLSLKRMALSAPLRAYIQCVLHDKVAM